jgi:mRNA interferase MazF
MRKGEIWVVDIGSSGGHEQEGLRPAIIIADVVGPIVTIIPFTSNIDSLRFPFTFEIVPSSQNGLDRNSVAVIFQLRAIDRRKLKKKVGKLDKKELKEINSLMKKMLGV